MSRDDADGARADPERWSALEALFHATAALAPEARSAHLRSACRDDPAMAEEVERLLDAADRADAYLSGLIAEAEERATARRSASS